MKDTEFLSKFPRTKAFLEKTGMTLEEAYIWIELELEKKIDNNNNNNNNKIGRE